jgi:TalC/MipB family fructose-6-phosphate aldolase
VALYVDSALLDEVAGACEALPIQGVTTNPSLLLAAIERGQRLGDVDVLRELLRVCTGRVFMQPSAAAERYLAQDPARVVLKLPMTALGVQAGLALHAAGAPIAFTATYTLAQAYLAAMTGAQWVIPYFCRLRRAGTDASERISGMAGLLARQHPDTRVLAASLKSPADVVEATVAGAHDVTAPPEVIRALVHDPLSEQAVAQFTRDWERAGSALAQGG